MDRIWWILFFEKKVICELNGYKIADENITNTINEINDIKEDNSN